jgi:glycerol-3-phosphate dehydrogenase
MRREIERLGDRQFDVLVIGGGAAGAATAREACLRGYHTALIEREDFGGGTSAHCFKVVHGGIRYLQHADIPRARASCRERAVFLRIAPHLVAPMPFAIPTYGRGTSGRTYLGAGMLAYDTVTIGCNLLVKDPARRVQGTRFMGRADTLKLFPAIDTKRLTGSAVFEDGQMYNPPRLVLAFAAAADELGATVANYVEAERLLNDGGRVTGVAAIDRLDGTRFDIRARVVINAAGPWTEQLLESLGGPPFPAGTYSRDACLVVARRPESPMALAVLGHTRDADTFLSRSARHLFLVPWRDVTLVGVWHRVVQRDPDGVSLTKSEMREFLAEINACYPALQLQESEVQMTGFGLVPFGEAARQQQGFSFGKQSQIVDHRERGMQGLLSLISVRYTVARRDAVAVMDRAIEQLGTRFAMNDSDRRPLPGGAIDDFNAFTREVEARRPEWMPHTSADQLMRNYGTRALRVLALAEREPALRRCLRGSNVSFAELAYAVREEMAERMTDLVFRRTELGTAGHPGDDALEDLQEFLRVERGWTERRIGQERAAVERHLERYLAATRPRLSLLRSA